MLVNASDIVENVVCWQTVRIHVGARGAVTVITIVRVVGLWGWIHKFCIVHLQYGLWGWIWIVHLHWRRASIDELLEVCRCGKHMYTLE